MELLKVEEISPRSYRLSGTLDLSSVNALLTLEEIAPEGDVVLDLGRLAFADTCGLERLNRVAGRIRGEVILRNPRAAVEKLIRKAAAREGLQNVVVYPAGPVDRSWKDDLPDDVTAILVTEHTPESLCEGVAVRVSRLLGTSYLCHIGVWERGTPTATAFDHDLAAKLVQVQVSAREGPALDALRTRVAAHSPSLVEERRWREFTNRALYEGIACIVSMPLLAGNNAVGVLTVYGQREHSLGDEPLERLTKLAGQAACALSNSHSYWNARELIRQLQEALESRAVIDQAKGILMAGQAITADEAFRTLRKASQRGNLKVRELALRVVDDAVHGRRTDPLGSAPGGYVDRI